MNYIISTGTLQSQFTYSANANTINFSDLSTGATSYAWDFGDGNTSTQQNPVNTYSAIGTYTACLAVSDGSCHDTVCKVVTISVVDIRENNLIASVSIFPNPASKNIFIDFGGKDFGKAEVSLSNIIGKTLVETTIPANGKKPLDVSEFSQGIYFLKLKTHSGIVTKKIVIAP
jgi:PKD repeat protein